MNRFLLAVCASALLVPACGGGGEAGSTPESTFEAMKNAAVTENFEAMVDLMNPADMKKMEDMIKGQMDQLKQLPEEMRKPALEQMAKQLGVPADEIETLPIRTFLVKQFEAMAKADPEEFENARNSEILETKIEGDKATLKVRSGDKEEEMRMVRVDGKWYLGM